MSRIMGVLALNASTYREIADDPNATQPASLIVVIVALVGGFVSGFVRTDPSNPQQLLAPNIVNAIVAAIVTVIFALIAWFITAWILAFVARWFGGKTNTKEMLRVTGYVEVFAFVSVLTLIAFISPTLLCLVGFIGLAAAILRLIGYIVGIREAAEFSTGNAIITALVAVIVNFIIYLAATFVIASAVGIVAGMTGGS